VRIVAIVPAYNEAARITPVLDTLTRAPSIASVVVVDDGSTDDTAATAERHPEAGSGKLQVVRQSANRGKGAAMRAGAEAAEAAEALLFLDADLIGLTVAHVEALVEPVRTGRVDMALGVFRGGNFWTPWPRSSSPISPASAPSAATCSSRSRRSRTPATGWSWPSPTTWSARDAP
jgi:polyisoprenyl-phosphate glycosyltransferase